MAQLNVAGVHPLCGCFFFSRCSVLYFPSTLIAIVRVPKRKQNETTSSSTEDSGQNYRVVRSAEKFQSRVITNFCSIVGAAHSTEGARTGTTLIHPATLGRPAYKICGENLFFSNTISAIYASISRSPLLISNCYTAKFENVVSDLS